MINRAITFATVSHANQTRKGTNIPYILHCLEAGVIAASLATEDGRVNSDVVCAAILHDTMEDAYVSYATLKEVFNETIADLVKSQSEDKTKSWQERKQATIDFLQANTNKSVEIATLADKLSNMRAIASDYEKQGEQLWDRFNADKASQHWYYSTIATSLTQLSETKPYQEYTALVEKTFHT